MSFENVVGYVAKSVEFGGIVIIVGGTAVALAVFAARWRSSADSTGAYDRTRRAIGRSILLGLELLVAGDIIRTVAISLTWESVGLLAGVVLIRTFLSFTLELEITGRWPWKGSEGSPSS